MYTHRFFFANTFFTDVVPDVRLGQLGRIERRSVGRGGVGDKYVQHDHQICHQVHMARNDASLAFQTAGCCRFQ